MQIVAEAESKATLGRELEKQGPRLLITDYSFQSFLQPKHFEDLFLEAPQFNILVISSDPDKSSILEVLESGIRGFLTKDYSEEENLQAFLNPNGREIIFHKIFDLLLKKPINSAK